MASSKMCNLLMALLLVVQPFTQLANAQKMSAMEVFDPIEDDDPVGTFDGELTDLPEFIWYHVKDRTCGIEFDFCPLELPEKRQIAGILAALGAVATGLGSVTMAGDSVNGFIAGAISNLMGIGSLIQGGVDLAKVFGLGPKVRAILVDNRCTKCELSVRCTSQGKDSGYIPLDPPDGYILKFVTFLPGFEHGLGGFAGLVYWTCEYKDDISGRIIRQPAFGGSAPREEINLFEVRNKGLYRMDQETGRIDARQSVIFW